jgi:hypothetical protein
MTTITIKLHQLTTLFQIIHNSLILAKKNTSIYTRGDSFISIYKEDKADVQHLYNIAFTLKHPYNTTFTLKK